MNVIMGPGPSMEWFKYMVWNSIQRDDVLYYQGPKDTLDGRINRVIYSLVNRKVLGKLGKRMERRLYSSYGLDYKQVLIKRFVFTTWNTLAINSDFILFLRKQYPDIKLIYILTGSMDTTQIFFDREKVNIEYVKQLYDVVCTFSKEEAKQYGLYLLPLIHGFDVEAIKNTDIKYDLCYVGNAKDRLDDIHRIYNELSKEYRLSFHIMNVPDDEIKYPGIVYNEPIGYEESLRISASSRAILEYVEKNQMFSTIRHAEAILLNRKFITNNLRIVEDPLYQKEYVFCLDENWKYGIRGFLNRDSECQVHPKAHIINQRELIKIMEDSGW